MINAHATRDTRYLVERAFAEHGPILTTEDVVRFTGRRTTTVRHYLQNLPYRKIGTVDGTVLGMSIWEMEG